MGLLLASAVMDVCVCYWAFHVCCFWPFLAGRRPDVTTTELRKPVWSQWLAGLEKTGRPHTRWVSSLACKNNLHWFSQRPPYINKKGPSVNVPESNTLKCQQHCLINTEVVFPVPLNEIAHHATGFTLLFTWHELKYYGRKHHKCCS